MPKFDVLTINQKHLAKVNVAKSNMAINQNEKFNHELIWSFQMWKRNITRQLKERKSLTSIVVEHIFD
jgi:hypothetical protein